MKGCSCYNFGMKKKIMKKENSILFTTKQLPNSWQGIDLVHWFCYQFPRDIQWICTKWTSAHDL